MVRKDTSIVTKKYCCTRQWNHHSISKYHSQILELRVFCGIKGKLSHSWVYCALYRAVPLLVLFLAISTSEALTKIMMISKDLIFVCSSSIKQYSDIPHWICHSILEAISSQIFLLKWQNRALPRICLGASRQQVAELGVKPQCSVPSFGLAWSSGFILCVIYLWYLATNHNCTYWWESPHFSQVIGNNGHSFRHTNLTIFLNPCMKFWSYLKLNVT